MGDIAILGHLLPILLSHGVYCTVDVVLPEELLLCELQSSCDLYQYEKEHGWCKIGMIHIIFQIGMIHMYFRHYLFCGIHFRLGNVLDRYICTSHHHLL